jgi:hypothetical protein
MLYSAPAHQGHNAMKPGHNPSNTAEYYLDRAAECERLITVVSTEEDRKALQPSWRLDGAALPLK